MSETVEHDGEAIPSHQIVLLDLDLAHEIDNMEGLAIHREAGRTIVTMISDDNYSSLQRTILLEFDLVG